MPLQGMAELPEMTEKEATEGMPLEEMLPQETMESLEISAISATVVSIVGLSTHQQLTYPIPKCKFSPALMATPGRCMADVSLTEIVLRGFAFKAD